MVQCILSYILFPHSSKCHFTIVMHNVVNKTPTHLVIHDDSVGSGVQQGCLGEKLSLLILVLLLVRLLHIVCRQCVKRAHLVALTVGIVQVGISSGCFKDLDEVIYEVLFVVLELKQLSLLKHDIHIALFLGSIKN